MTLLQMMLILIFKGKIYGIQILGSSVPECLGEHGNEVLDLASDGVGLLEEDEQGALGHLVVGFHGGSQVAHLQTAHAPKFTANLYCI